MKLSFITAPLLTALAHSVNGEMVVGDTIVVGQNKAFTFLGHGMCLNYDSPFWGDTDWITTKVKHVGSRDSECATYCDNKDIQGLVGFFVDKNPWCYCLYVNPIGAEWDSTPKASKNVRSAKITGTNTNLHAQNIGDSYNCFQKGKVPLASIKTPTKTPTKNPTKTPMSAGAQGDPHFKTWSQKMFDFHGVCDLMMLSNKKFENSLGMDIHIRTKKMRMWSYISALAIRIGKDILEVVGNKGGSYILNGIVHEGKSDGVLNLSGYPINYTRKSNKQQTFRLYLSTLEAIIIETWNSFVSVHFENPKSEHFKDSTGLLGSYPEGVWFSRDKVTTIDDANTFGQEWQVLESEAKMFHEVKGPKQPLKKCEIPSNLDMRRRLSERTMTQNEAERACVDVKADNFNVCVFDVMATNDIVTAGAY